MKCRFGFNTRIRDVPTLANNEAAVDPIRFEAGFVCVFIQEPWDIGQRLPPTIGILGEKTTEKNIRT